MQATIQSIRRVRTTSSLLVLLGLCVACAGPDPREVKDAPVAVAKQALTTTHTAVFQKGVNNYTGTSDTYLSKMFARSNYGRSTVLRVDGDASRRSTSDASALLRFDISSIPQDASVTAVSLTLYASSTSTADSPLYAMNREWTETGSNWQWATPTSKWQKPGATGTLDRNATALGSIPAHSSGTTTIALNASGIAEVQEWVKDPSRNFGLIVTGAAIREQLAFYSSEHSSVSLRPLFAVTYTIATADCANPPCCSSDADCDDSNACTTDTCVTGACSHAANPDCCTSDADCSDANACTSDTCTDHVCGHSAVAGCCATPSDCDDGNICTNDSCNANQCRYDGVPGCCAVDTDCNDGNICTTDACVANACMSAPITGCCLADADCNDNNVCTADACVANACMSAPITGCCLTDADCNDNNVCTTDACVANICATSPVSGCCATNADCNDNNSCTADTCVANTCKSDTLPGCCRSDAECDDGNQCTADACIDAMCMHVQIFGSNCTCSSAGDCNDGNPCTLDTCANSQCVNEVASCSDNNPATEDQCVDGYCHHTGAIATTKTFRNGQLDYAGATDARIAEANPTTNYGAETILGADGDDPSGQGTDVYSLLKWSDLGIPADATVTSATVTVYVGGDSNPYSATAYPVYAMRRTWTASEVTWQQADAASPWNTNGTLGELDRDTVQIASTPVSSGGSLKIDLTEAGVAEVQSWINDPTRNNGIVIASATNTDGLVFYSSDSSNVWFRPMLSVTYTATQTVIDPDPVGTTHNPSTEPKYGFFVYSDSHVGATTNTWFETALAQMQTIMNADGAPPIMATISLGDHTESGSAQQWDWHMGLATQYWDPSATSFGVSPPRYIAVPGNHEIMDTDWYTLWTSHFTGLAPLGEMSSASGVYYSFSYANALFMGLDTNKVQNTATAYSTDPQLQMLRSALSSSSAPFKFMFYHMPAYYCGSGGTGATPASVALMDLAAQNNVDVVFNGHSHVYSRTCRMTVDHVCTGSSAGTVQVEVGTVGASDTRLRGVKSTYGKVTNAYDASGVSSDRFYTCTPAGGYEATLGSQRTFCYVNVQGCAATVNCYQVGNTTPFDSWSLNHCQ